MRFGERVDHNCEKYQVFAENLQFVKVYKDLGVYVDIKRRFLEHVNLVVGRTSSMIIDLLRCTVCRSTEFVVSLWVSNVLPLLMYVSCVWNAKSRLKAEFVAKTLDKGDLWYVRDGKCR